MATRITTVDDLRSWVRESYPDLTPDQVHDVAAHMWLDDERFPHPVSNTDIDAYLESITDEFVYEAAGVA